MPVRNQQPAYMYGLSLLGNQPGPNQAGALGGIERAVNPIVAALLMKQGIKQQEAKDADYGNALLGYQQGVQNELVPSAVNATPPVAINEDPSMRDYSGVVQRAAPGEAMANALLGVKNPDVVRDLQPQIMQQQMADLARADERAYQGSQNLAQNRFALGQQNRAQQFATNERLGGQEYQTGSREDQQAFAGTQATQAQAAAAREAQANREAAAANAQAAREAAAAQAQLSRDTTLRAAEIRRGSRFLPPSAAKLENDDISAVQTANNIEADLGAVGEQITGGKLPLGMMSNAWNAARNMVGRSTPESRNYQSFVATMEKLRNDSLRLNSGVQTEGDSQRAWNELFANINDEKVVSQRIQEIQAINQRAAAQRMQQIQIRRNTYGAEPLDEGQFESAPAVNLPQNQPQAQAQGGPVKVSTPEEAMKLAPGTLFVTPDGRTKVR